MEKPVIDKIKIKGINTMKKIILSTLAVVTILSTTAVADRYTLAPDGSFIGN